MVPCYHAKAEGEEETSVKVIKAVRIDPEEAPIIDGKLTDPVWRKAVPVSGFIQYEPIYGEKPRDTTKVRVLYDRQKLYVGFSCLKQHPDQIAGKEVKRDSRFHRDDYVEVFLDTYHDKRNCYGFAVNCLGTQTDRRIANEGSVGGGRFGGRERAWDCSWSAGSSRNDYGWTAEMAIPFSELRFDKKSDGTWGINFWRGNGEFDEEDSWANVGKQELAVSRFGVLTGLTPSELSTGRPMEIKPYATLKPHISPDRDLEPDAGLDFRYPTSSLTADLTLNPDFAQVEADPVQINLQDVERKLPEKRPYFQEGMELFQTPIELFYSRRIGIKDLMYGAKVVGKLNKYNLALLDCQSDDSECGDEDSPETDNNYLVFRTQRDVANSSSIGFLAVNKQKDKGYNRLGSIDFNASLPADLRITGQYASSWVPDARADAFLVNLNGRTGPVDYSLGYGDIGRDFVAESGFIPRIDRKGFRGNFGYEYRRDSKLFRMFRSGLHFERLQNHDNLTTNERLNPSAMVSISNFFISLEPEWYRRLDYEDETKQYTDKTVSLFTGWFPPKWASARMRTMAGTQGDKGIFFMAGSVSVRPWQALSLEIDVDRLDREDERLVLNRRFTLGYQFSHRMFFHTTYEITRDDERNIFALYGWEFLPESNFYLVYTDNKRGDDIERIMFVKLSYLIKWKPFQN